MGIFNEWLSRRLVENELSGQQEEKAAQLFATLKQMFAGGFQNIADVAHLPLDKQNMSKEPNQPPKSGLKAVLQKLDSSGVFKQASEISPQFAKRATDARNLLTVQANDQQPNPSMNVGKFINMLFGREDAIDYYSKGEWKKNKQPDKQPNMTLTPPPQKPQPQGDTQLGTGMQPQGLNAPTNPMNMNMAQQNPVVY